MLPVRNKEEGLMYINAVLGILLRVSAPRDIVIVVLKRRTCLVYNGCSHVGHSSPKEAASVKVNSLCLTAWDEQ